MSDWKQTWKGEYIREFCKGEIGKILKHGFLWRVVLDDRRVDHIFLSAAEVSWAGEKKVITETNPKIAKEFISLIDIAQPFPTNRNK
mgnify:FL=1